MMGGADDIPERDVTRIAALVDDIHAGLRRSSGAVALPVDIEAVAAETGDLVVNVCEHGIAGHVRPNTTGKPVSGLIDFDRGIIHVDGREAPVRQRFTIAHELAHHLLGHASLMQSRQHIESGWGNTFVTVDTPAAADDERQRRLAQAEREADTLAGRLLIPRRELETAIATDGASVPLMAQRFAVSAAAMRRAMQPWLAGARTGRIR